MTEQIEKTPRYKTILSTLKNYPKNHTSMTMAVVAFICLTASYMTFEIGQARVVAWQTEVAELEAQAAADLIAEEKASEHIAELQKKQIIAVKNHGFTTVYNSHEDGFVSDVKNGMVAWAKEQGYDGIIIGRIQEPFDGGDILYTTTKGENSVPLKFVIDKLNDKGCKEVVSVMYNKTDFAMPYPVTDQTFGELKFYLDKGFSLAGFGITKDKLMIKASNFNGRIKEGVVTAHFESMMFYD